MFLYFLLCLLGPDKHFDYLVLEEVAGCLI